ncbi:glycosyltransferase family 2 protein [Exiguobacterium sp. s146]|uniref:glycosyltransferase family 2 protein n=1 Tax=Exiguobacterium sp. s146 TaxID=2751223 RepID=UPI001BEC7892|nr:glycosyltransferase family 2 protein [Exiguobacterium sp. s146]
MLFSVIIPLYNKEKHIKETILSVLNQTTQDFEIIVVDDGSTDQSILEMEKVSFNNSKIKLIKQVNQGVSAARNAGLREAKGEYISFLDADDIWESNYLEVINKLIILFPNCDIFTTAYTVHLNEHTSKLSAAISYKDTDDENYVSDYWMTINNKYEFVWTSATTIRKKTLDDIGFFNENETIGEDLDFFARIALNNSNIAHSILPCVKYNRYAENNARTSGKVAFPKAYLEILRNEMNNFNRSSLQRLNIRLKYDKKIIAYTYTLILAGQRKKAREVLNDWHPQNVSFKVMLVLASALPNFIIKFVYGIRLKAF